MKLLDDDYDAEAPLEPSATKRKVKFTGILGSPPKIPCTNDKSKSMSDTAEDWQKFDAVRLSPYSKGKDSSEKAKNLNMKDDTVS